MPQSELIANVDSLGSIHFEDAGRFHDRRFFLAFSESLCTIAIDVDPGKLLTVTVVNGDLPMTVFPAAVTVQSIPCFALFLFHVWMTLITLTMSILKAPRK